MRTRAIPWSLLGPLSLLLLVGCSQEPAQEVARTSPKASPTMTRLVPELTLEGYRDRLGPLLREEGFESGVGKPRALVIGLDGITPFFFQELLDQGRLPNIQQLLSESAHGPLISTEVPSSAAAWTSAFTGLAPVHSGVSSFFSQLPGSYDLGLVNATDRRGMAVWERADQAGLTSVVLNVPASFPPDPIRGIMLGGVLSPPDGVFTHPPSLSAPLHDLGYSTSYCRIKPRIGIGDEPLQSTERNLSREDMFTITYNQARLGLHLLRQTSWNLGVVVLTLADRIQHSRHLTPKELLETAYTNLDTILGAYRRQHPQCPLIVMSDHGFRSYSQAFLVSNWLQQLGWLEVRGDGIHHAGSRGFAVDSVGNYASIRLNIRGRDPQGVVQSTADIPALVEELERGAAVLPEVRSGRPLIQEIRATGYSHPGAADILLKLDPELMASNRLLDDVGLVVQLNPPVFDHDREGILAIHGPGVQPGPIQGRIIDVAPTLLYLLELPIPSDLDGRLLVEAFQPEQLESRPPITGRAGSARRSRTIRSSEDEQLIEYMRSIGYIN